MAQQQITEAELKTIIERILLEAETQAKYNGTEFIGLTIEDICQRLAERIGTDWRIVKDTPPKRHRVSFLAKRGDQPPKRISFTVTPRN